MSTQKVRDALAAGRAARAERAAQARSNGTPSAGQKMAMLVAGELTARDLDDEELRQMKLRGANGQFGGKRSSMIPRDIATQMQREYLRRMNRNIEKILPDALEYLGELVRNGEAEHRDRLKAVGMVVERVLGKTPDRVIVTTDTSAWDGLDGVDLDRDVIDQDGNQVS